MTICVPQALELALQHHRAGRLTKAETVYRQILAIEPNHPGALHFLGVIAHQTGRHPEAIQWISRAAVLDPNNPAVHSNLGEAHRANGQWEEASVAYRRALELQPGYTLALNNLGAVLTEQGRLEEAVEILRGALASDLRCAEAWNNLGNALAELGRLDEAIAAFERALALQPDHANASFGQSLVRLLKGDFERGWPLYEARRIVHRDAERHFPKPMWNGSPLPGQRVLVHTEQGFGDAIQFVRYASLIAQRGGEVIVECPRVLVELFRSARDVRAVVAVGEPLPAFDFHVPILSQPLVFHTTGESIPREVPYLFAEPARREAWRQRLATSGARPKVGLAWAGNPTKLQLRKRHISLESLRPLLGADQATFFSLQVGGTANQIQRTGEAAIHDFTGHLHDFAETAALMAELDLIISVDTAVAHLAGALGRPVWTLLPFIADWRWGMEGERSPWYPTMRLFRQSLRSDWESVIQHVAGELSLWTSHWPSSTIR